MTSIMTNNAALAALQTMRSINMDLETTQSRISSGYRVETAKDNSAYWSIATTMRSDNQALSTVQDALGLGAAKVDTAYTGMNSSMEVVSEIKAKLVAAREPGVDKDKINNELTELKNQLVSIAESASFSGENWLQNDSGDTPSDKEIVGSFNRAADGTVSLTKLSVNITGTGGTILIDGDVETNGILTAGYLGASPSGAVGTAGNSWQLIDTGTAGTTDAVGTVISLSNTTTDAQIDEMISVVDYIYSQMTDAASNLGAVNKRIEMQESFVGKLMDSIDKGVGRLVDADMNEESTRLKALQTQQQLGIQALSIANSSSQNVMSLFR
ncbi:MAG: flagellin [Rhizobiaceae bacterium]|nr:flagellin [Rhizobiaceae bacterium]